MLKKPGLLKSMKQMSLMQKMLMTYTCFLLIPLILIAGSAYTLFADTLERKSISLATQIFEETSFRLDNQMSSALAVANKFTDNQMLLALLRQRNASITHLLRGYQYITGWIEDMSGIQDNLDIRVYMDDYNEYIFDGRRVFGRREILDVPWYQRLINGEQDSIWFQQTINDREYICIAKKVRDPLNNNRITGVIYVGRPQDMTADILDKALFDDGVEAYIIDHDKVLLGATAGNTPYAPPDLPVEADDWGIYSDAAARLFVRSRPIAGTDWVFQMVIAHDNMLRELAYLRLTIVCIAAAVAVVGFVVARTVANAMTKGIRETINRMRRVKNKDFTRIDLARGSDEIGQLIDNYNFMAGQIQQLLEAQFESGKKLKSTELRLLQAQINPHFLYNSLNAIYILAVENDVDGISAMVKALTAFYRLALNDGKDFVSLWEEIQHIRAYVQVQNLRFDNGIVLEIDVPKPLYDRMLPKFTLQPIVENAIVHGIFEKEQKSGTVIIRGTPGDDADTIEIADDGVGFDVSDMQAASTYRAEGRGGYGLRNVNERLRLYFDQEMRVTSIPSQGTSVYITLPKNAGRTEEES